MRELMINLGSNSYNIIIEDDSLNHLPFYLSKVYTNQKIYIITDDNVANLYLDKVMESLAPSYVVDYVIVPHGEESKSIETYAMVLQNLLYKKIHRNELLLALGGGVIGDLTGFVAATLYRGMPYVNVPTSLLSQVDSSIGGKTGIDFANQKNVVGCFKQPKMVIIDPKTLDTLPKEEFSNGMGELIKHACIGNKKLFDLLKDKPKINEDILYESLSVKKRVVELDEHDQKERMILNFGHTFGHLIEVKYNLKHGEAVGLGMLMALTMGIDLKITDETCYEEVLQMLKLYHLPSELIDYKPYLEKVGQDKKNLAGTINFIFIKEIGKALIYPVLESKLKEL